MSYLIRDKVEAVRWSGSNWHQVYEFAGHQVFTDGDLLHVRPPAGILPERADACEPGDWLCKGGDGTFFPCPAKVFKAMYQEVVE